MGHLNLKAMLKVRAAVASVGLQWTREIRNAIKMSELSTNLYLSDPVRFDIVLESELSYFIDTAA